MARALKMCRRRLSPMRPPTMTKKHTLTDDEWRQVFTSRCRSKRGERITDEERSLVDAAFVSDRKRYQEMEPDVFDATVPFGSNTRARR